MNEINKENYQAWFLDYVEGSLSANGLKLLEDFLAVHPELRAELEEFEELTLPPDLKEGLDWKALKKPDLAKLHNDIHAREQLYIGAIEDQLNASDQDLLTQLLASTEYAREYADWQKTRLQASNESISHDDLYRFGLDRPVDEQNFEYYLIASAEGLLSERQKSYLARFAEANTDRQVALKHSQMLRLEAPAGVFFPDKEKLYRKEGSKALPLWWFRAAAVALLIGLGWVIWNGLGTDDGPDAKPLAEQTGKEPITTSSEADTTSVQSAPAEIDSEDDNEKKADRDETPALEDWEVREPEPVMLAEEEHTKAPTDRLDKSPAAEQDHILAKENPFGIDSLESVQPLLPEEGLAEVPRHDTSTQEPLMPLPAEGVDVAEISAPMAHNGKDEVFKTLPELAVKKLSEQFDISEDERDLVALAIARKLTEQAGEALNTEFKKQEDSEGNSLTYTLRIGSLKLSHSRSK